MFSGSLNSAHKRLKCLQAFSSCLQHIKVCVFKGMCLTKVCVFNELKSSFKINVKCLFGFSLQELICPNGLV